MARKQAFSAKEVASALWEASGVVRSAAAQLGCTAATVYNYADRYVTVRDAMQAARMDTYAEAQSRLVEMMRDPEHRGHRWAVEQVLRHYGREIDDGLDFTETQRIEHAGKAGGPVRVIYDGETPEPD